MATDLLNAHKANTQLAKLKKKFADMHYFKKDHGAFLVNDDYELVRDQIRTLEAE